MTHHRHHSCKHSLDCHVAGNIKEYGMKVTSTSVTFLINYTELSRLVSELLMRIYR